MLGKIDEAFWAERNAAWQTELAEVNGELLAIENAPPKADLLAAARKPVELLQVAPTLYVTQDPAEKANLLRTILVSPRFSMVGPTGIEPATTGLGNQCSIQLSYGPPGGRS